MARVAQALAVIGLVLLAAAIALRLTGSSSTPVTSAPGASTADTSTASGPRSASSTTSTPSRTSGTSASPSSSTSATSSSKPAPPRPAPGSTTRAHAHEHGDEHEDVEVPPRAQRQRFVAQARSFLRDLYATDRDVKTWRAALAPRLTSQAIKDMSALEPSWVQPRTLGRGGAVVVQPEDDEHAHRQLETQVRIPLRGGGTASVFLRPDLKISRYTLSSEPAPDPTAQR